MIVRKRIGRNSKVCFKMQPNLFGGRKRRNRFDGQDEELQTLLKDTLLNRSILREALESILAF